jgi:hypothetical protein
MNRRGLRLWRDVARRTDAGSRSPSHLKARASTPQPGGQSSTGKLGPQGESIRSHLWSSRSLDSGQAPGKPGRSSFHGAPIIPRSHSRLSPDDLSTHGKLRSRREHALDASSRGPEPFNAAPHATRFVSRELEQFAEARCLAQLSLAIKVLVPAATDQRVPGVLHLTPIKTIRPLPCTVMPARAKG